MSMMSKHRLMMNCSALMTSVLWPNRAAQPSLSKSYPHQASQET
jgi:hypothetical protein